MRRLLKAFLPALAASLLLVACGNGPSSSSTSSPASTSNTPATTSSSPASTSSTPTKSAPSSGGYGY
jgi:ABC-type glycerol-3-phosphate transport system substrate-binding protein